MSSNNWFARDTAGAETWAARFTGAATQALAGAATAGATAEAGINEFVIDGGGLLPPFVLIGAAAAGAVASAELSHTAAITGPRDSKDFVLRIAPTGELRAA